MLSNDTVNPTAFEPWTPLQATMVRKTSLKWHTTDASESWTLSTNGRLIASSDSFTQEPGTLIPEPEIVWLCLTMVTMYHTSCRRREYIQISWEHPRVPGPLGEFSHVFALLFMCVCVRLTPHPTMAPESLVKIFTFYSMYSIVRTLSCALRRVVVCFLPVHVGQGFPPTWWAWKKIWNGILCVPGCCG